MDFNKNSLRLILSFEENPHRDIEDVQEFITDASTDDIRTAPKQFTHLCHQLTESLIKTKRSVAGINLMINAVVKFQDHKSQLTQIHSDLLLLCLDAKCLNPALKFLDIDYTEIKKSEDRDDDVRQVLLFYYYGGLIYTAVKEFEKASFFFEVVLTMPANVVNPIMQETYKKQIIISLLTSGKIPENLLPRYTSPCVFRQRKAVGHQYLKLAHEYPSLNFEKLRKLVNSGASFFERDENMGLIKQCLTQVHKRNIQRLTKTFLTLALKDVADHVGLASENEAEQYILSMIDDGEIFATINQKDGMVVFQDNPEEYNSVAVFQKLQEDMSTCTSLIEILRKLVVDASIDTKVHPKMNTDVQ